MQPVRTQLVSSSQESPARGLASLFLAFILFGYCFAIEDGRGYTNCCSRLLCDVDFNASLVPSITILSGLRPNEPHILTLAREHTQRALAPGRDTRLSRVVQAGDDGSALEHDGPGLSDTWYSPTGAADVQLLWDVRYLDQGPGTAALVAPGVPAGAVAGVAASVASPPAWNARVLGTLEYVTVPLLRDHAWGNTSWLRQLDASASAGEPLPPQLLVPPPGEPGGPAAAPLLLLYRRDWWRALVAAGGARGASGSSAVSAEEQDAAAAAALPPTWPLLAQLASELLNRDLDGDGALDHVLCVDMMPGCKGWALLSAIYASMVQTNGTQQGVWFNLTDMSPALDGPALPSALRLYSDLAASNAAPFTPGGANASRSSVRVLPAELLAGGGAVDAASGAPLCGAVNPLFAAGRCLFTVDWAAAALRLTSETAPGVAGWLGAALLPGSDVVAVTPQPAPPPLAATTLKPPSATSLLATDPGDDSTATMQQCTASTCPYGDTVPTAALAVLAAVLGTQAAVPPPLLVNRAPLIGDAANVWTLSEGQSVDTFVRVDDFLRLVGYELGLKYLALLQPLLQQQQPPAPPTAAAAGTGTTSPSPATAPAAVYPGVTVDMAALDGAAVLQAVNASLGHPNAAMDVLLPYSSSYRGVIDGLTVDALALQPGPSPAAGAYAAQLGQLEGLVAEAAAQLSTVTRAFPYPSILLHLYLHSIGAPPPKAPMSGDDAGASSVPWRVAVPAAVSVVLFITVMVLGACLAAALRRRYRAKRRLPSCRAKPPGAGPATTLALTDVQSSTALWEVLSAELMDACMSIHHGIMRKAIESHGGYEVFTEGDAFAVAFHGPDDALGFAMDVQMAMLAADWPQELLDHPEACEVWARRNSHLQLTTTAANIAAAAAAATAGHAGQGSPRRITNAGNSATTASGGAGGGGGGGVDNTLLGLVRLTKGSKRLRALLGGGGSSRGGGASAHSLASGESFRASASAALHRLMPQPTAGPASQSQSPSPSQRPFSVFASQTETAYGMNPSGAGTNAAALAAAAADVEAMAAISTYGSVGQAPWSTAGPRPLPPLLFERFRSLQASGSPEGAPLRPWDNMAGAVRLSRVLGRQSAEGSVPWESLAAPGSAQAATGDVDYMSRFLLHDGYSHGMLGGPINNQLPAMFLQQQQPQQQQLLLQQQLLHQSSWSPQMRVNSLQPADRRQPEAPVSPAELRVGGELLEQSIVPQQLLQRPLLVPSAYLAASRSAGAAGGSGGSRRAGSAQSALLPLRPPPQAPANPPADTAAAGSTVTGAAAAAAAAPVGAPVQAGAAPPAPVRPVPEVAALVGGAAGEGPPRALVAIGEEQEVAGDGGGPSYGGCSGRPAPGKAGARSAPAPAAVEPGYAAAEVLPLDLMASAPIQSPHPPLPLHQQHQQQAQQQQHTILTVAVELQALRRHVSHIVLPLTPAISLSPHTPPPPQQPLSSQHPQQPQPRRGAARTASRLSLVSVDRDSDAAAATQRGGRRSRLLSLFSGGWRNATAGSGGGAAANLSSWAGGAMQPERSGAALAAPRLASFTVSSSSRSGAGGIGVTALAGSRSLSFTARHRSDQDRLLPTTRGSPLQPILSGSSGRSILLAPAQPQQQQQHHHHHPWHSLHRQCPMDGRPQGHQQSAQMLRPQQQGAQQDGQQQQQQQCRIKDVSECAAALAGTAPPATPPLCFEAGGKPEGSAPGNTASTASTCTSASASTTVPRRVSFRVASPTAAQAIPTPQPPENQDLDPLVEGSNRPAPQNGDSRTGSDSERCLDRGPDAEPEIPDRVPGRDWSLNPWLELQMVRGMGDPCGALGGLPRLAGGQEDDQATTSGGRAFESRVESSSRQLPSRDDWRWQLSPQPDGPASMMRQTQSMPPPAVAVVAAADTLAGPLVEGPSRVFRRNSSGATSGRRRRSTGCSYESSGSAGDVWRTLHETADLAKAAKRRSTTVTTSTAFPFLPPATRVPSMQATGVWRPRESAPGDRHQAATAPAVPAPARHSAEAEDTLTLRAMGSPPGPDPSAPADSPPEEEGATPGPEYVSGGSGSRSGGSRGGGSRGGGGDGGSGQLVRVDVDVLAEADHVLRRAAAGEVGGNAAAAKLGRASSGRDGVGGLTRKAPKAPVRSSSAIERPRRKAKLAALSDDDEDGTPPPAVGGSGGGGGARRRRGGGGRRGAPKHRHDPAALLDDFDDGGGGLEWHSVVTWEVDLERSSELAGLESMDICQQMLQTMAVNADPSRQLSVINPHAGGWVGGGGGSGADSEVPHPAAAPTAANKAFFRTWRNIGGNVAQLASEGPGAQVPTPVRRHACTGANGVASTAAGGGGGSGAVTTTAAALLRTHATLFPTDPLSQQYEAGSQEEVRRTSSNAGGSGRLLARLGQRVRRAVLRGAMGERDRGREPDDGHPHARSEGACSGGLPARMPGPGMGQTGSASWLHRPSRLRPSIDVAAAAAAAAAVAAAPVGARRSNGDGDSSALHVLVHSGSSGGAGEGGDAPGAGAELSRGGGAGCGRQGDGGEGGGGGDEKEAAFAEEAMLSVASMGMGGEASVQSNNTAWDSAGAAGQLTTGDAAAVAAGTAAVLGSYQAPQPSAAGMRSIVLAALANDSDDARSYFMRPEYVFGSGPAVLLGNMAAAGAAAAAAAAPPPPPARAAGEDGSAFDLLWRDLNAAASAPGVLTTPTGRGGGLPQAAAATVASALRLLYDQLTHAEAVLSYIMEGGSGVHRDSTTTTSAGGGGGGPELVLRGLRIRIGLHSGPREEEVELSVVDRVHVGRYRGEFLGACKEVCEAAVGGVVVLSGAAFRAYHLALRSRGRQQQDAVMLLHVGDHVVKSAAQADQDCTRASAALAAAAAEQVAAPVRELYAAVSPGLLPRLAVLPSPVHTAREVVPGCLSAPAGVVTPVFCNVVGVEALLAWEKVLQARMMRKATTNLGLPHAHQQQQQHYHHHHHHHHHHHLHLHLPLVHHQSSTRLSAEVGSGGGGGGSGLVHTALELLRNAVSEVAALHDGYVVASSADGGHWVLVFGSAENAVLWGLGMLEAMLAADWPEAFLEHELTEEVWEGSTLLKRGLRLRIGIDCGRAMVRLVPRTGRLDYVGRPLNRAARIAAKAKAATVLVSDAVWSRARPALGPVVSPASLGLVQLKGVKEPLELWALKGRQAGSGGSPRG